MVAAIVSLILSVYMAEQEDQHIEESEERNGGGGGRGKIREGGMGIGWAGVCGMFVVVGCLGGVCGCWVFWGVHGWGCGCGVFLGYLWDIFCCKVFVVETP